MAKSPIKKSSTKKSTKTSSAKKSATKPKFDGKNAKPKFDTSAFVFETPIEHIEEAIQRLEEQENDPMAEPLTNDQLYWWGWYELNLKEAKRRKLKTILTSARENAILGIPKKKRKSK